MINANHSLQCPLRYWNEKGPLNGPEGRNETYKRWRI